jgi:hypothetical protein
VLERKNNILQAKDYSEIMSLNNILQSSFKYYK